MNKSKHDYEWWDYSWNPISGCSPVSVGCENCYAKELSNRFGRFWGRPEFHPERLDQPQRIARPSRIFVCSVSDLFHEGAQGDAYCQHGRIFEAMLRAPYHTYIILTKRANLAWTPKQCDSLHTILGVTGETQALLDERWQKIQHVHSTQKFISVEPMLEPIRLYDIRPDWVVCGPENGPNKRPCDPAWIDELEDECFVLNIPFFDKRKNENRKREFPKNDRE